MTALPPPPIPAEVDLSDFAFMPLEVRRLRDSKFAVSAEGEHFRAGLLLWCASWHQIPAGSLPDDNVELAQLAGYGRAVQQWKKIAVGSLYGWKKHSDGRLYHAVVVEKAIEAWRAKMKERYSRECDRLRKENKRHVENSEKTLPIPSFEQWDSARRSNGIPTEFGSFPAEMPINPADVPGKSGSRRPEADLKGQGRDREGISKGDSSAGHTQATDVPTESGRTESGMPESYGDEPPHPDREARHAEFLKIRDAYPPGLHRDTAWQYAEREYEKLREEGVTRETLVAAVVAYRAQIAASKREVLSPQNFFGKGEWCGPFPLPVTPESDAETRKQRALDAAWARVMNFAASIGCELKPYEHDTPDTFETRVKNWDTRDRPREPGAKPIAVILAGSRS